MGVCAVTIIPIATRWNYDTEQLDAVLSPEDYEKVRQGYGCSVCLADYNGIWQATCPTCGNRTPQFFDLHPNDTSFAITKRNG